MNQLRELRIKKGEKQAETVEGMAIDYLDVGTYSRIENGHVNPTPEMAVLMSGYYDKDIFDIWPEEDLDYKKHSKNKASKASSSPSDTDTYNFHISSDIAHANRLQAQINAFGLKSKKDWFEYCLDMMDKKMAKRKGRSAGTEAARL